MAAAVATGIPVQPSAPQQVRFAVALVGPLRPRLLVARLKLWESEFFEVVNTDPLDEELLREPREGSTGYLDADFDALFVARDGYDISVAIIDAPLNDGYYMRRLSGNRVLISVYEIAPLLVQHGYSFEAFVYRNLYQLLVAFHASGASLPTTPERRFAHTPTRGCLFDWNDNKQDILNSLDHPGICRVCAGRYLRSGPMANRSASLLRELARIQRPPHLRLLEWLNRRLAEHPWRALGVAMAGGVLLNLVASYLFEWLKSVAALRALLP